GPGTIATLYPGASEHGVIEVVHLDETIDDLPDERVRISEMKQPTLSLVNRARPNGKECTCGFHHRSSIRHLAAQLPESRL
ncbi:MAG TPA: hypothetical protein VEX62_11280, partial [Candidatus Limnocylindrales bacterium]|nr:hypothetical protein [Candidatus Limnocylindrales bacterium]